MTANRNTGKYGNVTGRLYDGGTATFTAGRKSLTRRQLVLYGGGGAAALALLGGGAYTLIHKRRKNGE